jgi:hypothetical protein
MQASLSDVNLLASFEGLNPGVSSCEHSLVRVNERLSTEGLFLRFSLLRK